MAPSNPAHARQLGALFERILLAAALAPAAGCCFLSTRVPAQIESSQQPAPASFAGRPSGQLARSECQIYCGQRAQSCYYLAGAGDKTASLQCDVYVPAHCVDNGCMFGCGRVPEGLEPLADCSGASDVARYFGRMAQLEAASVAAFAQLGAELSAHGAPASLRRRARDAARDEARHARIGAALARRFGGAVRWPAVSPPGVRPLARVALENAAEGCVREAFAALLARHQSVAAGDARVRAALAVVARDEARHAALAWAVDAWASPRISRAARARVRAAKRDAADEIAATFAQPSAELIRLAGVPAPGHARAMLRGFREALGV